MNKLNSEDIKGVFCMIKEVMDKNKDKLFKLDSEVGDGDLGVTMSSGFNKVYKVLSGIEDRSIGNIFMRAGFVLAEAAPSSAGTLIATGLINAGKVVKDKVEVSLSDLSRMIAELTNSIMERGGAKPGEKTIVDSFYPASQVLNKAAENNEDLKDGFRAAYQAAKEGTEATEKMISQHGRSVWFGEKTIGKRDPGAFAGMLIIKAFCDYLENN